MAITYMTQEGYDKKMAELAHLENVERPEVVRAIVEARDKGDLSENAEYDAAKERQGMLEAKIAELKSLIASARIIDESNISTDEVQLLTKVTIRNLSISTPIAKGLLGHKVGEKVEVQAPAGLMKFEILKIEV